MDNIQVIEYTPTNNAWKYKLSSYIDKLEKNSTVGVFCYHDLIAFNVFLYLTNAGYKIPEQVGIVGYDDLPISQIFNLTTFSYSYDEIVKQSIACLIELIENFSVEQKNIQIQTILISRASTNLKRENP